jgi:hypothetical protein
MTIPNKLVDVRSYNPHRRSSRTIQSDYHYTVNIWKKSSLPRHHEKYTDEFFLKCPRSELPPVTSTYHFYFSSRKLRTEHVFHSSGDTGFKAQSLLKIAQNILDEKADTIFEIRDHREKQHRDDWGNMITKAEQGAAERKDLEENESVGKESASAVEESLIEQGSAERKDLEKNEPVGKQSAPKLGTPILKLGSDNNLLRQFHKDMYVTNHVLNLSAPTPTTQHTGTGNRKKNQKRSSS